LDTLQDATHSSLPSSHRERREEYFQKKKKKNPKKIRTRKEKINEREREERSG